MDHLWHSVATRIVEDTELLEGFVSRLRCLINLTTASKAIHKAVGPLLFASLGQTFSDAEERAAAAAGIPTASDIALMCDGPLVTHLRDAYGVVATVRDNSWRGDVLQRADALLVPLPDEERLMGTRVTMLMRLVARRSLSDFVSVTQARRHYCLPACALSEIPRFFPPPTMSRSLDATIVGMPLHVVLASALYTHGSSAGLTACIASRASNLIARAQAVERTQVNLQALSEALAVGADPDTHHNALTWAKVMACMFPMREEKLAGWAPMRAQKISRAFSRTPSAALEDRARALCIEVEAREASVEGLKEPMQRLRAHAVVQAVRMFVMLGRPEDAARIQRVQAVWKDMDERVRGKHSSIEDNYVRMRLVASCRR